MNNESDHTSISKPNSTLGVTIIGPVEIFAGIIINLSNVALFFLVPISSKNVSIESKPPSQEITSLVR